MMTQPIPMPIDLKVLDKYRLWLKYSDDIEGVVDLSDLVGQGVFALWKDYKEFQKAHIDSSGEIAWNDDVDLDSEAIYLKISAALSIEIDQK